MNLSKERNWQKQGCLQKEQNESGSDSADNSLAQINEVNFRLVWQYCIKPSSKISILP